MLVMFLKNFNFWFGKKWNKTSMFLYINKNGSWFTLALIGVTLRFKVELVLSFLVGRLSDTILASIARVVALWQYHMGLFVVH